MGAVDTTYTFTATDTITSAKMNNIIDQTTITTDAIIGTTLDVASGKLKVRSAGITSNEMGANSVVTAAITDANITQTKLAPNVAGNGPAFRAWASTSTTIPINTSTKVDLLSEDFDTNSNFSSSRFTPSVAGYYFINGVVAVQQSATVSLVAFIKKNGSDAAYGSGQVSGESYRSLVSDILYFNGSTDYAELFVYHNSSASKTTNIGSEITYFSGCLIRSA